MDEESAPEPWNADFVIEVVLPVDRWNAGELTVREKFPGITLFGPVPVLGKAEGGTAAGKGNPDRTPTMPYGDTPTGVYSLSKLQHARTWKFDEDLPSALKEAERLPEDYTALTLKLGLIYGQDSALLPAHAGLHARAGAGRISRRRSRERAALCVSRPAAGVCRRAQRHSARTNRRIGLLISGDVPRK